MSIAILLTLFGIIAINISPLPSNTLQNSTLVVLMNDLRAQQTLAMANNSSYGIRFENNSYTLFMGDSYVPGAAGNFVVSLDEGIEVNDITFLNSIVVFQAGSGEIQNYMEGNDGFDLESTVTGKRSSVRINKYGARY